jgi:hypothetical protein
VKYSEGVRSRPDIRLIPFAVTELGTIGGHATAFCLTELAKRAAASKGMHVGKLMASWRPKGLSHYKLLTRTIFCAVCPPPQYKFYLWCFM